MTGWQWLGTYWLVIILGAFITLVFVRDDWRRAIDFMPGWFCVGVMLSAFAAQALIMGWAP